MGLLVLILVILFLVGVYHWGYHSYGYWPSGSVGLRGIICVVLLLTGRLWQVPPRPSLAGHRGPEQRKNDLPPLRYKRAIER